MASFNVSFSLATIDRSSNPVAWNLLHLSQPHGFPSPLVLPFPGPDPLVVLSRLLSRMALPPDLTQSNPSCIHSCQMNHFKMLFFQATVILKFLQRFPTTYATGPSQSDFNILCKFKFQEKSLLQPCWPMYILPERTILSQSPCVCLPFSQEKMPFPGSLYLSIHP